MTNIRTAFTHTWRFALAFGIVAALLGAVAFWPTAPEGISAATIIGVDADPAGNTANSLGSREACREVNVGDDFDVDVYIQNASDLKAFDIYFGFTEGLIEVRDPAFEAMMIVGLEVPDSQPDYYFVGVGSNSGGPGVTGEGVLARMHLHAKAQGVSEASVRTTPLPPYLSSTTEQHSHTSPILNAQIAIGTSCSGAPTLAPTPTAPPTLVPTPSPSPTPAPTASPEPTATPGSIPWGDANCMQGVTIDDAIAIAQLKAGVPVTPIGSPCPNVGADVVGASIEVTWGDFNCDGQFNLGDAIAIMRYLIGVGGSSSECPSIATNYVNFP